MKPPIILDFMEPQKSLLPIERDPRSYRYFPTLQEQKTSFNKEGTRFFYFGQIQHDQYEKRKLQEFNKYLETNKIQLNDQYWNVNMVVKFLSGNAFKFKETVQAIKSHDKFREEYWGPNKEKVLFDPVSDLIKSGFFYPCGRDKQFRPVLVFNVKKVDLKDIEKSLRATVFVQEEMIKNVFLPGQIESWDIIYDLASMGITEIPIGVLKDILQKMSLNYGGRLYRLWVVNAPLTVSFSWKVVSAFLDKVTVDKIKISKSNTEKDIFNLCDPSQVEKKYGGKQEDRKEYWPFGFPQGVFDEKRLISEEGYEEKLKNGELSKNRINPKYS